MQVPASDWSSVVEEAIESIPLVTTPLGSGSGVVVHESGLVLTNKHVIEHGEIARLKFRSGECVAQVLRVHETADLALLKTHAPQPELQRPLPFREEQVKLGEPVLALGHPNRHLETVNAGIVSGLQYHQIGEEAESRQRFVRIDAAINSGNSGGPTLDQSGKIIGINTWKRADQENSSFAIESSVAVEFLSSTLEQLANGTLDCKSPEELADVPFDPKPRQSIEAAFENIESTITGHEAKLDEESGVTTFHWDLMSPNNAPIRLTFRDPNEKDAYGLFEASFEVAPPSIALLSHQNVLQRLLRHNEMMWRLKFSIAEDGTIKLCCRRPAIDLDPTEVMHTIRELELHTSLLVTEIIKFRKYAEKPFQAAEFDLNQGP